MAVARRIRANKNARESGKEFSGSPRDRAISIVRSCDSKLKIIKSKTVDYCTVLYCDSNPNGFRITQNKHKNSTVQYCST